MGTTRTRTYQGYGHGGPRWIERGHRAAVLPAAVEDLDGDALDLTVDDDEVRPDIDRVRDGQPDNFALARDSDGDYSVSDLDADGGEVADVKVRRVAHADRGGRAISAAGPVKVTDKHGTVTEVAAIPEGTNPKSLEAVDRGESKDVKAAHVAAFNERIRIARALDRIGGPDTEGRPVFRYHLTDEQAKVWDNVPDRGEFTLSPGPVAVVHIEFDGEVLDRFDIRRGPLQERAPDGETVIQRAWDRRKFGPDPLVVVRDRTPRRSGCWMWAERRDERGMYTGSVLVACAVPEPERERFVIECRCNRGRNCPLPRVPVRPEPCLCGREPYRTKSGRLKFPSHRGCSVGPDDVVFWSRVRFEPWTKVYRAATITPESQADIDQRDWTPEFDRLTALMAKPDGDERGGGLFGIDPEYFAVKRMLIDEGRRALGKLAAQLGGLDAVEELVAAERARTAEDGSTGVPEAEVLTDLQAQALAWHRAGLSFSEMERTDPEHRTKQTWRRHYLAALEKVSGEVEQPTSRDREVLDSLYRGRRSYRETAADLGMSPSAVQRARKRAIRDLKDRLTSSADTGTPGR